MPLLVLGEARRRRLEARLGEIARTWHARWASEGSAEPVVALGHEPAASRAGTMTVAGLREGVVVAYVTAGTEMTRALIGQGAPESTVIAGAATGDGEGLGQRLLEGVLRALCGDILQAAFAGKNHILERRSMPEADRRVRSPHARNLCACLAIGRGRSLADLVLTPELADALIGARPKAVSRDRLVSRALATREQLVRVRATLGAATVNWRDLTALTAGDVVVLEQTLDSSSAIVAEDGTRIADAQLGAREGLLAVLITRIAQEDKTSHA
jgi:hypothetical protein